VAARSAPPGRAGLAANAGTTVACPAESLPLAEFRRQLEVNLTRHLAVIQAFRCCAAAGGSIVNGSSVGEPSDRSSM
jgi:NAD(P)-dependent dehydrogenase (short-subunit alcohol dehydrogenase family)